MNINVRDPYVHEVIDYSGIIHDVIFARIVTLPFFEGFTARRCKQMPTGPILLPYLGVYVISEEMPPDGAANHGHIAFIHDMKMGISVQMAGNDPVALELKLNEAFWQIMSIWTDQYTMNLLDTYNPHTGKGNPHNVRIESVERGFRRHNWGVTDQETPWAELQYEPVLRYRTYYPPGPFDDLKRVDVRVVPMRTHRTETTPWQVRHFLNEELRDSWIKDNKDLYEIRKLAVDGGFAVQYRTVTSVPPHVPPDDEVQRIIMKYEFDPKTGDYKPPPYKEEE